MLIPVPTFQEDDVIQLAVFGVDEHERIRQFLDVQPWLCPTCRLTNFGRNLSCASWKCKQPRPNDFVEERRK